MATILEFQAGARACQRPLSRMKKHRISRFALNLLLFGSIPLLILLFATKQILAQDFMTDLYGFRLGQYRVVPKNELGEIIQQGKFDDGFEYEIFLVEPDSSVYLIFEYPDYDTNIIWSIQITGPKVV
jgi:hypothetical protein